MSAQKCNCGELESLADITQSYTEFIKNLQLLSYGQQVKLMKCFTCNQLWIVEEWDKYQASYAVKIQTDVNWQDFDFSDLIKERIIHNRGGLGLSKCVYANCESRQVNSSAYCAHHLYEMGKRS